MRALAPIVCPPLRLARWLALLWLLTAMSWGQGEWIWDETAVLIAGDSTTRPFGHCVALSGDTALIGAPGTGNGHGSVHVSVRTDSGWTRQAVLGPSNASQKGFGTAVAIDGDRALIAAEPPDGLPHAVFVFTRSGTTWSEEAQLVSPYPWGWQGVAISISGDTALVGSSQSSPGGVTFAGSAFVYVEGDGTWPLQAELVASDGEMDDYLGQAVSLSGDTALVGAWADDDLGDDAGSTYVFERTGTVWQEQAKLRAIDGAAHDGFGFSVALCGEVALVGAPGRGTTPLDAGAGYVFRRTGSSWIQSAILEPSVPSDGLYAGYSVDLSADLAVLSAPRWDLPGATDVGAALVFQWDGVTWHSEAELTPSRAPADFGYNPVCLDGGSILVGLPGDVVPTIHQGSVTVFERSAVASATFRNDTGGTNPTGYWASAPILGQNWTATVDNSGTGHIIAAILGFAHPLELYLPVVGEYRLIDPLSPGGELLGFSLEYGHSLVTFTTPVPAAPSLAGFTLSTQGASLAGVDNTTLHNAYDLSVGQ